MCCYGAGVSMHAMARNMRHVQSGVHNAMHALFVNGFAKGLFHKQYKLLVAIKIPCNFNVKQLTRDLVSLRSLNVDSVYYVRI